DGSDRREGPRGLGRTQDPVNREAAAKRNRGHHERDGDRQAVMEEVGLRAEIYVNTGSGRWELDDHVEHGDGSEYAPQPGSGYSGVHGAMDDERAQPDVPRVADKQVERHRRAVKVRSDQRTIDRVP